MTIYIGCWSSTSTRTNSSQWNPKYLQSQEVSAKMRQEYRYEQKMLELFREGVKITVADLSLKGGGGSTPCPQPIRFSKRKRCKICSLMKHFVNGIYSFGPVCFIKIYVNWNHLQRRTPTLGLLEGFIS